MVMPQGGQGSGGKGKGNNEDDDQRMYDAEGMRMRMSRCYSTAMNAMPMTRVNGGGKQMKDATKYKDSAGKLALKTIFQRTMAEFRRETLGKKVLVPEDMEAGAANDDDSDDSIEEGSVIIEERHIYGFAIEVEQVNVAALSTAVMMTEANVSSKHWAMPEGSQMERDEKIASVNCGNNKDMIEQNQLAGTRMAMSSITAPHKKNMKEAWEDFMTEGSGE